MTTIREVAREAGVSVATVSRVLNNNGYVNDETRKKVEAAIEQLDYRPNVVARSLFKKKSGMIGLIVPDITNPFFPQLARAVEDVAAKNGYSIVFGNTDQKLEKELEYLDIMEQKYVDGLIIGSNNLNDDILKKYNKPTVMIDRGVSDSAPFVQANNQEAAREAVSHLIKTGSKVIAHLSGPEQVNNAVERCRGYLDVVKFEPWFKADYIREGDYTLQGGYKATIQLLNEHPEVDALFAANDLMAIGALKAAHDLNVSVPEDFSVIGFDGIEMGEVTVPELSTMKQPIYKIGEKATELLVDLIGGRPLKQKNYELPVELCARRSTKSLHFSSVLMDERNREEGQ